MQFLLLSLALGAATAAPLPQKLSGTADGALSGIENELGTALPPLLVRRSRSLDAALGINPDALANGLDAELVDIHVRDHLNLPALNAGELRGELSHTLGAGLDGAVTGIEGTTIEPAGGLPVLRRQDDGTGLAQAETAVNNGELALDQQTGDVSLLAPLEGAATDVTSGVENGANALVDSNVSDPGRQAVEDVVGGVKLAGQTLENGSTTDEKTPTPVAVEKRQLSAGGLTGVVGEVEGEAGALTGELGVVRA